MLVTLCKTRRVEKAKEGNKEHLQQNIRLKMQHAQDAFSIFFIHKNVKSL